MTTLRKYLTANMFDGDESGVITMKTNVLLDEICQNVAQWVIGQTGTDDWMESYYVDNEGDQ